MASRSESFWKRIEKRLDQFVDWMLRMDQRYRAYLRAGTREDGHRPTPDQPDS